MILKKGDFQPLQSHERLDSEWGQCSTWCPCPEGRSRLCSPCTEHRRCFHHIYREGGFTTNRSTFIAINLSSDYLWVFKWSFVRRTFPHSLQLTYHPIICEFSDCALFAKSFSIQRKMSCSQNRSTIIAINLSSNHLWNFKLWVLRQIFPHSSQLTCHPIFCEFSNEALFAKSFHIHC